MAVIVRVPLARRFVSSSASVSAKTEKLKEQNSRIMGQHVVQTFGAILDASNDAGILPSLLTRL